MESVFFGLSEQYDTGSKPSVDMNEQGVVLDVHKNEAGYKLYYRVGTVNKAVVNWGNSHHYDDGNDPSVALNDQSVAVEVHKNQAGSTLYYHVGTISGNSVNWSESHKYDSGIDPAVALNNQGTVIEVHKTQSPFSNGLYYHVGQVKGNTIDWSSSHEYDSGSSPDVAINNQGLVIEVHKSQSKNTLWYHIGHVDGSKISFGDSVHFDDGASPSVSLNDDGFVVVTWTKGSTLMQRVGKVVGNSIQWQGDAEDFDAGQAPSVALNRHMSVQVHPTETILYGLWYSTSLLTDRAQWMQQQLSELGSRPLSQLTLPATHDAAMYLGNISSALGKTQDLNIYQQLNYGVRWFDLRPKWTGSQFIFHHGIINGPKVTDVLDDVKRFCEQGYKELVLLKLSHFDSISDKEYPALIDLIATRIDPWLVKSAPAGKRLADVTLDEYVKNGPAVLMVVDGNLPISHPSDGFWVYRDWDSGSPEKGDLTVYDKYSDTISLDTMTSDQLGKFEAFDGKCENNSSVPCDLFLLSWTLTPPTFVWEFGAKKANPVLGSALAKTPKTNRYGKVMNMLYVDYVEYARATDVAIIQNES